MKWGKFIAGFRNNEDVQAILDETGHKGFTLWVMLVDTLNEHYEGRSEIITFRMENLRKSCRISSQNLHKTFTKLSQICNFSFTIVEGKCQIRYPTYLKIQRDYFRNTRTENKTVQEKQDQDQEQDQEREIVREKSDTTQPLILAISNRLDERTLPVVLGWHPPGWRQEKWVGYCITKGLDLAEEVQAFLDSCAKTGKTPLPGKWAEGFTGWLKNAFGKRQTGPPGRMSTEELLESNPFRPVEKEVGSA